MPPFRLRPTQSLLPTLPSTLTLPALPQTDIWSTPPSNIHFNAPFTCTQLSSRNFRSLTAKITPLSPGFTLNSQQAGLFLALPGPSCSSPVEAGRRWVTATLEYEYNKLNVSVVGCERWADWSLMGWEEGGSVILRMERGEEKRERLVVSVLMANGEWRVVREVAWVFETEVECLWVGLVANQAYGEEGKGVEVRFEDVVVETV